MLDSDFNANQRIVTLFESQFNKGHAYVAPSGALCFQVPQAHLYYHELLGITPNSHLALKFIRKNYQGK